MMMKTTYQNILFLLLIGLVIFIPLYPKFPLLSVPGTYVAIRIEDFLIALVLLFWFIYQIKDKNRVIMQSLFWAFVVFWFTGLVSLFSGIFITHSVLPHLGLLHWLRRVEFMMLFWVAVNSISSMKQLKVMLSVFFLVTFFVIFYGFGQVYLGFKVVSTIDKDFSSGVLSTLAPSGRVNSTFAGHYDLAIFLSYFLILACGAIFYVKKYKEKLGIFFIAVLSFILLGFTASRISFFGAIAGLTVVLLLLKKRRMIAILIFISILIVMVVPQLRNRVTATITINIFQKAQNVYVPLPTPTFSPQVDNQRTASERAIREQKLKQGLPIDIASGESTDYTELEVGRSLSIRLADEWPRALNAFYKNPLLGTGYSSLSLATDNDYLRALGETGLIGFISLVLIFSFLFKGFFVKLNTKDQLKKTVFIVAISIIFDAFITGTFIDILEASKAASIFWILLGAAWAVRKL
jgi:O-antigen ligase